MNLLTSIAAFDLTDFLSRTPHVGWLTLGAVLVAYLTYQVAKTFWSLPH